MAVKQKLKKKTPKTLRASVSFPESVYRELEKLAKKKKVSVAWIVRDAAEKYVEEQWPLFKSQ
jgi:metal-responsive CopG/Arc/MetJ family transcriptional regulator